MLCLPLLGLLMSVNPLPDRFVLTASAHICTLGSRRCQWHISLLCLLHTHLRVYFDAAARLMDEAVHERQKVSPAQSTFAGLAAFVGGAAIAGGTHYVTTAKRLAEEGIDPTQRVRAMPVALRALGVSTVICTAIGAGAWFALQHSGVGVKPVVEVASLHETIAMAQQQRDLVAKEFQKKLYPSEINHHQ